MSMVDKYYILDSINKLFLHLRERRWYITQHKLDSYVNILNLRIF